MRPFIYAVFLLLCLTSFSLQATESYPVKGKVIDQISRVPVAYATVYITSYPNHYAISDSAGFFSINSVPPGIYTLSASCMGYKEAITPQYIVSAKMPPIIIEMEQDVALLNAVTVRSSALERSKESPVSLQIIGVQDIEKIPGGNRDISRVIRSYPGVSFSPIGYRNDLIVRGGSPAENRFYLDGIEIPNINHFATQGASGGPVSILNADLIEQVHFYTGAFPADKAGGLSSIMDIRLRDGNPEGHSFKATLGASEVSFSGTGHIGKNTTYLFSLRQSYLQVLFKLLGLPFLPNYIDGQFKIKSRLGAKDEIVFLGLAGIDNMKLNTEEKGEEVEYLLSYLPRIKQQTFTLGSIYRHYYGKHTFSLSVSYNYLHNDNLKYKDNDDSLEENLMLSFQSTEQKVTLRAENKSYLNRWTIQEGAEVYYADYSNNTLQRVYADGDFLSAYATNLPLIGWGAFASAKYTSYNKRFTTTAGFRFDACNYSPPMNEFWRNFSPRVSLSYSFLPSWSLSGSVGLYHQLPPYTALGFKNNNGEYLNKELLYMQVLEGSVGIKWNGEERWMVSLEGFYKQYGRMPLSLQDSIPLACKGNDYGVVGNEALVPTATGHAYGLEAALRWQIPGKWHTVASFTLFKSEYRNNKTSPYIPSAWDNRFLLNASSTYMFGRHWSVGVKLSCIGGVPYTPYDVEKSSLVEAWNAQGRPYYNYSLYNTERLKTFAQLDVRVDKSFYFKNWMLGFYIDLQNVTSSKLKQPDVLMSTGVIENPSAPPAEQRYKMKYIKQESGTLVPTIGITVEF